MSTYKLIGDEEATLSSHEGSVETPSMLSVEQKAVCLQASRNCSTCIGVLIGIFIQCSTLGLNFLLATYGRSHPIEWGTYLALTLIGTAIASTLAVTVLLFLRHIVVISFYSTKSADSSELPSQEEFMVKVINTLETFFGAGALGGVGLAWFITDLLLGVEGHIIHSAFTMAVASLWYVSLLR